MRLGNISTFRHDSIDFNYFDSGAGTPFFFQHGLGGDLNQPCGLFKPIPGIRLISFDCRAHGETRPLGPEEKIGLTTFADDLQALMQHLQISQAVVGGISMGAAVALNFTLRHPECVRGLVMQRPAWLDGPRAENVAVYAEVARLIRTEGPEKGLETFQRSSLYQIILAKAPSAARTLSAQFLHPRAPELAVALDRIPLDCPNNDRTAWRAIRVPTLVLANRLDPIHPFEYGQTLAQEIPGAEFHELTPKSVQPDRHKEEIQLYIGNFLRQFV